MRQKMGVVCKDSKYYKNGVNMKTFREFLLNESGNITHGKKIWDSWSKSERKEVSHYLQMGGNHAAEIDIATKSLEKGLKETKKDCFKEALKDVPSIVEFWSSRLYGVDSDKWDDYID